MDPRAVTGVMMVASTTGSITFISYIAQNHQTDGRQTAIHILNSIESAQTGRERVDGGGGAETQVEARIKRVAS